MSAGDWAGRLSERLAVATSATLERVGGGLLWVDWKSWPVWKEPGRVLGSFGMILEGKSLPIGTGADKDVLSCSIFACDIS